jgi:DNA end-binding protein Ku
MAPRSLWNGTITFGAVAVPVKLYTATDDRTVHFHEVHLADGARIEHRPFCTKEDKQVDRDEIVKGFAVTKSRYVVVDQEEIDAAGGSRTRIVAVDRFVALADIDPVFFDKTYYLGAGDAGPPARDAYRLLHDALERSGRAAIARFTFHNRERLVAIRAYDKVLALHTMRFADELVDASDLDVPDVPAKAKPAEVRMAGQLIDGLHAPFRPEKLHDEHREAVLAAIERRADGEPIETDEEPEPERPDDLLEALKASLPKSKGKPKAKSRRRTKAA